jgi:protein-S-isoprenylcysteine O-methyltransferase Ste14
MLGTFGLTIAPMLPSGPVIFHSGTMGAFVESVVLVIAFSLALIALDTLGRSFSITPQARRLVARGPYCAVRHPLYLFEAMAILAITFASGTATMMIGAVIVLASQVRRAQLEERLLNKTFPEYEAAFRGVPRFLPGIY